MPRTITDQGLRKLIDTLLEEGKRVVGPRAVGGITLYQPLASGEQLDLGGLPRRSAKEVFFPVCEDIATFERDENGVRVRAVDPRGLPETVLVGVRPCDAVAAPILDSVFACDGADELFVARRKKTTIIGLACTTGDGACFCTAVGLSPADTRGSDVFLSPLTSGGYRCDGVTEKGEALLSVHADLLAEEPTVTAARVAEPTGATLDLDRIKRWLDTHFEDPFWDETAARCVGCGACAFVCPVCHCFDIVDEGGERKGSRRKSWDSCGFAKFTQHASGHNPRDVQPRRYRNRIMHKFAYAVDQLGRRLCTGCARCIRYCPVGLDIASVLEQIGNR